MIEQFDEYRRLKKLFKGNERIILAVSGGIDSLVMLDIFKKKGYNIAVAHCNFQLRGKESDGDEQFVADICRKEGIRLFKQKFNTREYASRMGISIQMAARDLRYDWLEKVRKERGYDLIATGHNLNDTAETMLINLTRGTGIKGLTGIAGKSGSIIRPMLFATRDMIEAYAIANKIDYREDSSNIQTKYSRNKIRHNVIPVLEKINPSVLHSLNESAEFLESAYSIYIRAIETKREEIIKQEGKSASVKTDDLKKLVPLEAWIYELFKTWGFGRQQVNDIIRLMDGETGRQLFSKSHLVTKDRDRIMINPASNRESISAEINSISDFSKNQLTEKADLIPVQELQMGNDPAVAYLDADLLSYPMNLRKWKEGDYFYPLGMKGRKKISDLLIDLKVPLPEKEKVHILEMEGKILWVIGLRIDDRFKVSESTTEVLQIKGRKL